MNKNNSKLRFSSLWNSNPNDSLLVPKQQIDASVVYEMATISCLIKNRRLTSLNIAKEIEDINSKAYFS
jgi:hypothetical protein